MKILYISHMREGSGWSNGAIESILALDSVGIDVVCRSIKINNYKPVLPEKILELESKSIDGCNVCIQHVLPYYIEYNSKVKNIANFYLETNSAKYSGWENKLKLMDQVWVTNKSMQGNIPFDTKVVPIPTDLNKYSYSKSIDIPTVYNSFKFYSIIDFNKRKNLIALLRAFHTEFRPHEPVDLVLKISGDISQIKQMSDSVKKSLKIRRFEEYKGEIIINNRLSEEEIWQLHNACDCYISTSYNEAWCIPLVDAIGFGNSVLSNWTDGPEFFLKQEDLINCQSTNCFNTNDTFQDLYTAYENWYDISIPELRKKMREKYESKKVEKYNLSNLSYQSVGKLMEGYLNE